MLGAEIYSGFSAFQVIPFPQILGIANTPERVRLVLVRR
jgi:hypothetical protein